VSVLSALKRLTSCRSQSDFKLGRYPQDDCGGCGKEEMKWTKLRWIAVGLLVISIVLHIVDQRRSKNGLSLDGGILLPIIVIICIYVGGRQSKNSN
jgi:hypothetical protein